jgi:hypothetical protein
MCSLRYRRCPAWRAYDCSMIPHHDECIRGGGGRLGQARFRWNFANHSQCRAIRGTLHDGRWIRVTSATKVEKKQVPVVLYTATHKIEGFYHAFDNGGRLLDDLNGQERQFVPLVDVRVTRLQGDGELMTAKFLAVNLHSVAMFLPNPKLISGARLGRSAAYLQMTTTPRQVSPS